MFQINDTKNRIWTLLCGFCLSKTQISTSKYTKICFKLMKTQNLESVMWILLTIKNTYQQAKKQNMLYGFCKCWNLLCGFCNATLCFFIMIVAKYRNVSSCFWYCKIQKKIAAMQVKFKKRQQKCKKESKQQVCMLSFLHFCIFCNFLHYLLLYVNTNVAKYRNVFSCLWYCKIKKKDSRNAKKRAKKTGVLTLANFLF